MALLRVEDLRTYFHTRNGVVRAVDGISYEVKHGETRCIVGGSGAGKSVSCYTLLGLLPMPPGKVESGKAVFDGTDLLSCSPEALRRIRGKRISMIFQDPMTCLNPYLRIGEQLIEPLLVHESISREEAMKKAAEGLRQVGIRDAEQRLRQYPHEFSGGMRQRVMIAMALIPTPELLIADEPTTALDVTVQAQILDLIKRLQREHGTAVIFITHDLGVIAGVADRVQVMYAGRIVESGPTREVFYSSRHPYTRALLRSLPSRTPKGQVMNSIPGLPPDVSKPIQGCAFAPRCESVVEGCRTRRPEIAQVSAVQASSCLRVQEGTL
jgi:oligopeptide transport system ATP-binding protein